MNMLKEDIFAKVYDNLWYQTYHQIGTSCNMYLNDHLKYSLEDCLYGELSATHIVQLRDDHATSI